MSRLRMPGSLPQLLCRVLHHPVWFLSSYEVPLYSYGLLYPYPLGRGIHTIRASCKIVKLWKCAENIASAYINQEKYLCCPDFLVTLFLAKVLHMLFVLYTIPA